MIRAELATFSSDGYAAPIADKLKAQSNVREKLENAFKQERGNPPELTKAVGWMKDVLAINKERASLRVELGDAGAITTTQGRSHPSKEMEWKKIPGTNNFISSYRPVEPFAVGKTLSFEVEHPHFNDAKSIETVLPPPPSGAHWEVRLISRVHPMQFVGVNQVTAELVANKGWSWRTPDPVQLVDVDK